MLVYNLGSVIKIPKNHLKYTNIRAYIYKKKGTDTFVSTVEFDKDFINFPRNKEKFLKYHKKKNEISFKENVVDSSITFPIVLKDDYKLKEKQQYIINELKKLYEEDKNDCIIQAPTGLGKTAMLPALVATFKKKTLILVDLMTLREQMLQSFLQFTKNCDIQLVTKDTKNVKDINIASVQLLNRNEHLLKMFQKEIGMVIVDEVQIVGAETIKNIVGKLPTKYRIGLSATPTRSDGLTEVLTDLFEHKIVVKADTSVELSAILVHCSFMLYKKNYKDTIKEIIMTYFLSGNRYFCILDYIVDTFVKKQNKSIMIATDDIELQNIIKEKYKEYGTDILNSKVNKKRREEILNEYEKEEIKILIGYRVLKKGVNIPRMEILINLFSATTKEDIEQLLGRLNRKHKKKKKVLYIDFVLSYMFEKQKFIKIKTLKEIQNKLDLKVYEVDLLKFKSIL